MLAQPPIELWVNAPNQYRVPNVKDWDKGAPIWVLPNKQYAIHVCNHLYLTGFYLSTNGETLASPSSEFVANINPGGDEAILSGLLPFNTQNMREGDVLYIRSPDFARPLVSIGVSNVLETQTTTPTWFMDALTVWIG